MPRVWSNVFSSAAGSLVKVRESLRLQPVQRAGCVPVKVLLKTVHLQPQSEGMGRKREERGEQEAVDGVHDWVGGSFTR
jgi:hypothetical protein